MHLHFCTSCKSLPDDSTWTNFKLTSARRCPRFLSALITGSQFESKFELWIHDFEFSGSCKSEYETLPLSDWSFEFIQKIPIWPLIHRLYIQWLSPPQQWIDLTCQCVQSKYNSLPLYFSKPPINTQCCNDAAHVLLYLYLRKPRNFFQNFVQQGKSMAFVFPSACWAWIRTGEVAWETFYLLTKKAVTYQHSSN